MSVLGGAGSEPPGSAAEGGGEADPGEGFGCQECVGVCSEVLSVGQFLFPCSTLGGWHGGVLGLGCWKPALALRFPELHPGIGAGHCFLTTYSKKRVCCLAA